jgi:hypothetical protein
VVGFWVERTSAVGGYLGEWPAVEEVQPRRIVFFFAQDGTDEVNWLCTSPVVAVGWAE